MNSEKADLEFLYVEAGNTYWGWKQPQFHWFFSFSMTDFFLKNISHIFTLRFFWEKTLE